MIYYLLLGVSVILAACKSSLYNSYAKGNSPTLSTTFRFNALSYGVAALITLIGTLLSGERISLTTVACAFFYAVIVISLQTVSITAMSVGAMSTTAICVMYGMIIPAVAGPIFWQEPIGVLQIVGISMMLISLWLIRGKSENEKGTAARKWIALAILAFFLSGMAGVMEKIHQSTAAREERLSFVFIACAFMLAFSLAAIPVTRKRGEKKPSPSMLRVAVLSGVVIGFYSTVNLILSGKLDSMIYYPIANGGAMILTVAASAIIFKESFDKKRVTGILLGVLGILCLSLPI